MIDLASFATSVKSMAIETTRKTENLETWPVWPDKDLMSYDSYEHVGSKFIVLHLMYVIHSRPQSPRSFWSAPRIETSGRDRSRKSANHGLPAFVRSLRNLNNNGYYRLLKWAAIALARYLAPARGLDPWRRPKGSWALGTRMSDMWNWFFCVQK